MRAFFPVVMMVLASSAATAGDGGPVVVIPGRGDVPVPYYGRDISGAVVEGDWGLNRPSDIALTVIYPRAAVRPVAYGPPPRHYFPSLGTEPVIGRREAPIDRRPRAAQSYSHSYSAQSAPTPATAPSPYDNAPVIIAPQNNRYAPQPNDEPRRR